MNYPFREFGGNAITRVFASIVLILLLAGTAHADRAQALQALAQRDYGQAARLWLQLANEGDPLAQFNLALLYEHGSGVNQDANLYKYWLSMAARQGLADAYATINTHALRPTNKILPVSVVQDPQDWVATQNPGYYTLQLASSTNKALIQKYYDENDLIGVAGYYRSRRSGEDWYALVYGAYPTVPDAKAAIEKLPDALKKWSPWVRNIKSIHRIMIHQ